MLKPLLQNLTAAIVLRQTNNYTPTLLHFTEWMRRYGKLIQEDNLPAKYLPFIVYENADFKGPQPIKSIYTAVEELTQQLLASEEKILNCDILVIPE